VVRFLAWLLALALAAPAAAGSVNGRVDLTEKRGRKGDASEVVVYLHGSQVKAKPAQASVVMKRKRFIPRLTVVPVGSEVAFPNDDPIFHNAFSVSGDNRFDLDLYRKPQVESWTFQAPGVVRVYCNIHPQMSAVVFVTTSPHYSQPAADGTFTIANVPAGSYTLHAWHERGGEASVKVQVPASQAVTATLSLDAARYKRVQHKNKYGEKYSTSETYR
jgi:plastocyanin